MAAFVGTSANDTVVATSTADTVSTGAGNDRIFALGGNDMVRAGDGSDYVEGGNGNDTVYGGSGRDTIWGGAGDDVLYGGGGGIDFMAGGAGADLFIVLAGDTGQADAVRFYGPGPVDQWVRIHDLDFAQGDRVALQDGDASDGFLSAFLEVNASGVTNQMLNSFKEWQLLGNYLLRLGGEKVYENTQQGSLTYLLSDDEGQTHAVEFYGYSLSDLGTQTLTFDDLTVPKAPSATERPLSEGYGGLTWSQVGVVDLDGYAGLGYRAAPGADNQIGFFAEAAGNTAPGYPEPSGTPLSVSRADGGDFTFLGANFSSAFINDLEVTARAYDDGVLVGTKVFQIDSGALQAITFDAPDTGRFTSIDRLEMDANSFFGFDNFSYLFA